jgi:hypothetical protein
MSSCKESHIYENSELPPSQGINDSEILCVLCGSTEITDLGLSFTHCVGTDDYRKSAGEKLQLNEVHENHVMCDTCLKDFIRVCTCEKPFKEEPKVITVLCPCASSSSDEITRLYFDIEHDQFLKLLSNWNEDYYIIEGCRGCRFSIKDIQNQFKIGLQAAIEACVYKKFEIDSGSEGSETHQKYSAMKYQSDALDDDFVNAYSKICETMGVDNMIGEGTTL